MMLVFYENSGAKYYNSALSQAYTEGSLSKDGKELRHQWKCTRVSRM